MGPRWEVHQARTHFLLEPNFNPAQFLTLLGIHLKLRAANRADTGCSRETDDLNFVVEMVSRFSGLKSRRHRFRQSACNLAGRQLALPTPQNLAE